MFPHKRRLLSATVVATAMLTTAVLAGTMHTQTNGAQATTGSAITDQAMSEPTVSPASERTVPSAIHGNFACPLSDFVDCKQIKMWLPE